MNSTVTHPITAISSLDIANTTGREHHRVMRDIHLALSKHYTPVGIEGFEKGYHGHPIFLLPYKELVFVLGEFSLKQRALLLDRFNELERCADRLAGNQPFDEGDASILRDYNRIVIASEKTTYAISTGLMIGKPIAVLARELPDVNVSRTKSDLVAAGYLKKADGQYLVRAPYRYDTFIEKVSPWTGNVKIVLGPKGPEVLKHLHARGALSLLKSTAK